ncbi:ABC transporter [Blastococcus sp. TF02-8]|nr:ABC transporter [Blastococcus sp. TF02-8]
MSVHVNAPLDEALERTRAALADQGFGILSEIDVAATLKAKLDVDVPPQIILGACNAPLARQGLQIEPDLGLLLPCNVVVRTDDDGQTLVSALNPELMVTVPGRPELEPIAADAKARLQEALRAVADRST